MCQDRDTYPLSYRDGNRNPDRHPNRDSNAGMLLRGLYQR
jgi:hypothetical protein